MFCESSCSQSSVSRTFGYVDLMRKLRRLLSDTRRRALRARIFPISLVVNSSISLSDTSLSLFSFMNRRIREVKLSIFSSYSLKTCGSLTSAFLFSSRTSFRSSPGVFLCFQSGFRDSGDSVWSEGWFGQVIKQKLFPCILPEISKKYK